jgi:hypothetical protein
VFTAGGTDGVFLFFSGAGEVGTGAGLPIWITDFAPNSVSPKAASITPDIIISHSIFTASPNGPKTAIPNGSARPESIVITLNTRPILSASVWLCIMVMLGVLHIGIVVPQRTIIIKYSQKTGTMPNSAVIIPNKVHAKTMVYDLFLNPPQTEMVIPPAIAPADNATSAAVSRHISSPNERATCNGIKNATGAMKKEKNVLQNSIIFSHFVPLI